MQNKLFIYMIGVCLLLVTSMALAEERPMGFFVTSVGMGNGADLGGLEGADAHCKKLASAVGAVTGTGVLI